MLNLIHPLKKIVSDHYLHPILVNFTAALVPVSIASDVLDRLSGRKSFREAGWWTMLYAACVTPLTALTGWLFWMKDDVGVNGMTIHKWLGMAFVVLIPALAFWRARFRKDDRGPNLLYFAVAVLILGTLVYQSHLGGAQVFKDM